MAGATPKSKDAKAKSKGRVPEPTQKPASPKAVVVDPESSESDEEDDGVDEEGMQRLLAALGDDGLDEYDQEQLAALGIESASDDDDHGPDDEQKSEASLSGSDAEELPGQELEALDDSEDEDDDADEDEDVALDEIPSGDEDVDMDIVPTQKVTIDDKAALDRIHALIKLDPSMPWTETLTVTYTESINVDVDNDLERELAFYKQALHGAQTARALAKTHNFPWTRPADYFAEMVKSDSHMERVRQKLLDESAGIKRSEEKRREREGKKFGKQVQQEKLRERAQARKDLDEKIKGLKRKRKDGLDDGDAARGAEDFDVALDDDRPSKRAKSAGRPGLSRAKRDSKFGVGSGGGRRSKQNTRDSTDDFHGSGGSRGRGAGGRGGFKAGGSRGGAKRLGKSRRQNTKSKK